MMVDPLLWDTGISEPLVWPLAERIKPQPSLPWREKILHHVFPLDQHCVFLFVILNCLLSTWRDLSSNLAIFNIWHWRITESFMTAESPSVSQGPVTPAWYKVKCIGIIMSLKFIYFLWTAAMRGISHRRELFEFEKNLFWVLIWEFVPPVICEPKPVWWQNVVLRVINCRSNQNSDLGGQETHVRFSRGQKRPEAGQQQWSGGASVRTHLWRPELYHLSPLSVG